MPAARLGLEPVAEADEDKWLTMYQSNVLGLMRMTRALLPQLEAVRRGPHRQRHQHRRD